MKREPLILTVVLLCVTAGAVLFATHAPEWVQWPVTFAITGWFLWNLYRPHATEMTYAGIAKRAQNDRSFRDGLQAAAFVCRAQGQGSPGIPPCPSGMAAVYIDGLSNGVTP